MSSATAAPVWTPTGREIRREIARFLDAAQRRCEVNEHPRRRSPRRYHRSWPLWVGPDIGDTAECFSVALHNANELGIAFLSNRLVPIDQRLIVRLFWHDADALCVPIIVRHSTPTPHGHLVGCEFILPEPDVTSEPI